MIYDAIYALLTSDSDVTDLVSTRIYPDQAPQKVTNPYVVFLMVSGVYPDTHQGGQQYVMRRFQFDAWAETRLLAEQIRNAIRAVIEGFSQISPVAGTVIQGIIPEDEGAGYDDETELFRARSDYRIHHVVD